MAKDKVCLIINPVSGTESKKNIPEEVAASIDQKKQDLIIRVTGYPEHATEIARQAAKKKYNLAGVRFGRTRIYNHKSLEGTLAGVAVTAAALCLLIPPLAALVTVAVTAVAELVSPVDDNLVIPVVACLALTVLL